MSELAKALVKWHATNPKARLDSKNPHFKSEFASLESVIACVNSASAYGITFMQPTGFEGDIDYVETIMIHEGGEERVARTKIKSKDPSDPQKYGAGITYAKRFGLQSLFGIADTDDDGNLASQPPKEAPPVGNSLSNGATPTPQTNPPAGGVGTSFDQLIETYPDEISRVASFEQGLSLIEKILKEAETPKNVTDFFNTVRPTDAKVLSMFSTRKEELDGAK